MPESLKGTGDVEIIPEMIEAGLEAYRREKPGEASDFNEVGVVSEVYRSMARAHRALINRGQIAPIPPKEAYPPGRSLQPVGSYASGLPSSMSDSSARRADSVGFR